MFSRQHFKWGKGELGPYQFARACTKPPDTQNSPSCLANTMNSQKMLHTRPKTRRFAVVFTHSPSLPTHIPLAFLRGFHLVLSFNGSFRFFLCLLHLFLSPVKSSLALLSLCLLPSPSSLSFSSSPSPFPGICNCDCSAVKQKGKTQAPREPYLLGLTWNKLTREQLECNFM